MAFTVGDAVMVFSGNTENLDTAFQQLPGKAEKAFSAATVFNQKFNEELDATGDNVKFAGEKILSLTDSFRTLAIQGPERLKQKLDDARNAFQTLQSAGITAKGTLLEATIKVTEREIAYRKALGDSTVQLSQELTALQTKYSQLSAPVQSLAQNFQFTGRTASTVADLSVEAGDAMESAGRRGSAAFHETRNSVDLLAGQMGVALPRELKNFLASLGPVQGLLSTAFKAFAIVALAEVIVEATKKTTEWIAQTFIFTEAERALNAALLETNKAIVARNESLKELIRQREFLGKTAAETADIKVRFAVEDEGKAAEKLRDVKNEIYGVRNGLVTLPQAIDVVNGKLRELHKDLSEAELAKQNILLPKDADRERVIGALSAFHDKLKAEQDEFHFKTIQAEDEQGLALTALQTSFDTARVNARQVVNAGALELQHQQARIALALQRASYSDQIQEQRTFEDRKYQNELSAQRQQLEILQRDPTKNVNEIVAANAKIEDLEKQHEAKILADLATFAEKRRAILDEARRPETSPLITGLSLPEPEKVIGSFIDPITHAYKSGMEQIQSDTNVAIAKMLEAFRDLGIQGSLLIDQTGNLVSPLQQAQKAYDDLKTGGIATYADLLKAQIALTEAEIENAQQLGQSTQQQEQDLARLEDRWASLTGAVRNNSRQLDTWRKEAKKDFDNTAAAFLQLRGRAVQALDAVSNALEQAIASAILGQQSFAAALAQAVAKTLAAWAAEDAIHALRSTALGFYSLAIHDYSAAADAFKAAALYGSVAVGEGVAAAALGKVGKQGDQGSPAAPGNLPPTPATIANPNPPQRQTIVHLATGGLVTKRTEAIIGDSIRAGGTTRKGEGILPLDDDRAMDAIAGEIASRMPNRGTIVEEHNHFNFNVEGMISADNLSKIVRRISSNVERGRDRLYASNSLKVTRKA